MPSRSVCRPWPFWLLLCAPLGTLPAQDLLVQCRTLVVAPDTVASPGELLVRDGKVAHVGREIPADARARARVLNFGDATIVPAFVLAHTSLGRDRDLAERALPMTPTLRAADAFDPCQPELLALPRFAVGSCALSPASTNVASGIAALVKPGEGIGSVRQAESYARFSLSAAARNQDRAPTALMGAIDLLRQALLAAKQGLAGGPDAAVFAGVLRGERRAFVHAETRAEILATLALGREFGFEPVLIGASQASDVLDAIAAARAAVVLWPLDPTMREAQLRVPQQLEGRAVPFCFCGDAASLRPAAALAVAHGCSRRAALAALTRTPAELCGAAATQGSLRRGCDADFAVFSADPLDLSAKLQATFVGGVRLFGEAPRSAPAAPDLAQKESL